MQKTVSEICRHFISDKVLKEYSYLGQRNKLRFKDFDNITKLIISSTIESMQRVHRDIFGKNKEETEEEKKSLYESVHSFFTREYIKKAEQRYKRSLKLNK